MGEQLPLQTVARVRASAPGPTTQLGLVRDIMLDGKRRTLWDLCEDIKRRTGKLCAETALSARLRDLRKLGYVVHGKARDGGASWEYWVSDPWGQP